MARMPVETVKSRPALAAGVVLAFFCLLPARAEVDRSRYLSPKEVRPGMKGFGRTVMSGTRIETFEIEVISVMTNAFYAQQDIILVRCSGLNLEHSGIIGGMSGSPCYVRMEDGTEKMIGAVAYGWTFNKDPICGLQPITQMIDVVDVRHPSKQPAVQASAAGSESGSASAAAGGTGRPIGELIAKAWPRPIPEGSRFSIFNEDIARLNPPRPDSPPAGSLRPLRTPVMMSGVSEPVLREFRGFFEEHGMEPVQSGGASPATREAAGEVRLEPGSVLCVPLMRGDIGVDALGTCTEVIGDQILGFGHPLDGRGTIRLPVATGMVHTVIPSVMRSNKLGAALEPVGTLYGDESTAIFGITGDTPQWTSLEVTINDVRGKNTYHYELAQDEEFTPLLLSLGSSESLFAHSAPPREHTIRYQIEMEFEGLGTFRAENFSSPSGTFGLSADLVIPAAAMMDSPFGKAMVKSARVEATIEDKAHAARIDRVLLPRDVFKPGETVTAHVRWLHYRSQPTYTEQDYTLTLPDDLPDGDYQLAVGSPSMHFNAVRQEKPHLFRAENLGELLERLNQFSRVPENRLYMRLSVPEGGLAVDKVELPSLPSFQARILADSRRPDVQPYKEPLVKEYDTPFAVSGSEMLKIKVNRRMDQ